MSTSTLKIGLFSIGLHAYWEQFAGLKDSHGPAHHCAVGVGHIASKITKLAALLGMDIMKVC